MYPCFTCSCSLSESASDFRILRRLVPKSFYGEGAPGDDVSIGVIVDVETTGFDPNSDEVIELAMVKFQYTSSGVVLDLLEVFQGLNEPTVCIPGKVSRLTGITSAVVAGQRLDSRAIGHFIADASIIVAHNARFDRPFCETLSSAFQDKPWGCSLSQIDWVSRGHPGTRLAYLLNDYGLFHDGHRALDDCYAVLEVLSRAAAGSGSPPFKELLDAAHRTSVRVYADRAPMAHSPTLKGRGYRWSDGSAGPRAWWKEIDAGAVDAEVSFLRTAVYQDASRQFTIESISPFKRFSRCPADVKA